MRCQHCDAELAAGEQVCVACGTAAQSVDSLSVTAAEKPEIRMADTEFLTHTSPLPETPPDGVFVALILGAGVVFFGACVQCGIVPRMNVRIDAAKASTLESS